MNEFTNIMLRHSCDFALEGNELSHVQKKYKKFFFQTDTSCLAKVKQSNTRTRLYALSNES